jgi:sporulation protein YlmC with PRC-barrel domain
MLIYIFYFVEPKIENFIKYNVTTVLYRGGYLMAKQEKSVTRDMIIGMQVIDSEGRLLGTVKDVAFTVGKAGISLHVESKKGETQSIAWDEVQAIGDFIILKPPTQTAVPSGQVQQICPTCKGPLSYIQQYQRWYCYKCQKYV